MEIRHETCPHCGGTVTIWDKPIHIEEQAEPVGWIIERARCENGCDLLVGEIPNRQA